LLEATLGDERRLAGGGRANGGGGLGRQEKGVGIVGRGCGEGIGTQDEF
jgi:hypothetical protein